MDCTDSKSLGSHVESAEYVLASDFAAVMQVQTSAVVHSSPGEDQELKMDTCALGSGSSPSAELEPKKDTSTTTAHSTELPTTKATTSRGGVEPMYSRSAPKCQWTETLPEEEDPSGEETSDDEDKEATTLGEDPSSEEDEEATTSGGVKPIYSGTAPKCYWTQTLPAKEEDPSGVETSVNEEDEKLCFRLVRRIYPSELKIVRKIAQGGQAKIFLAKYLKTQKDVVVKRYTSCQVQAAELQRQMERVMKACEKRYESGLCRVIGVSVDEKGRVSTVMELMGGDLRIFIDRCNPFLSYGDRLGLMKAIASGIKELHGCGFIHKDLKASNILVSPMPIKASNILVSPMPNGKIYIFDVHEQKPIYWKVIQKKLRAFNEVVSHKSKSELDMCVAYAKSIARMKRNTYWKSRKWCYWRLIDVRIGDYESSDVVLGTGFFRAPEVLRALRDGTNVEYSAAVDVYGFGMVCYELLTGKLPFQGHPLSDYDLVLSGQRPDVSNQLPWMRNLLHRCWHEDPHQRPGWDEILQILR
jgi:serine/threonine protein kinase